MPHCSVRYLLTSLLVAGIWSSLTALSTGAPPLERDVLIEFKADPGQAEEALIRNQGGTVKASYWVVPAIAARLPDAAVAALARNPNVVAVESDVTVTTSDIELDNAWGVARIGGGIAQDAGYTGAGVRVAVIDTGIDYRHSELAGCYAGGWDFVNNDADPMDDHGHGTHVAGTIAAADNGVGVVGVAPGVSLYALKVLNANGSGSFSSILSALQWCIDHGIQVTNNSYGTLTDPGSIVQKAFDNAAAAGIVTVAAAGNSGNSAGTGDNVNYPAKFATVVAVAATTSSDTRASYSSTGPAVELAAPGNGIYSTIRGGGYGTLSGTSMACPHVAGSAAVLVGAGVTDVADVRFLLAMSSEDLGAVGVDNLYGYGLVDLPLALSQVGTSPPPDTDPPPPPPPGTASVDWIAYQTYGGKLQDKHLSVGIAIVDETGTPISGAAVSVRITRNGALAYSGQATTDSNGLVSFSMTNAKTGTYVTTVTGVSANNLVWDGLTPPNSFVK